MRTFVKKAVDDSRDNLGRPDALFDDDGALGPTQTLPLMVQAALASSESTEKSAASVTSQLLPWLQKTMIPLLPSVDESGTRQLNDIGLAGYSILSSAESASQAQSVISGESTSATSRTIMGPAGCNNDSSLMGFEVLLVDDDPVVHLLIRKILKRAGLSTTSVRTGEEALALLDKAHDNDALKIARPNPNSGGRRDTAARFPDAIILDINFPIGHMSGMDTVKEIRRRFPRAPTPIIAHTVEEHLVDLMNLLDAGFSDYVSKRSTASDLLARICVQVKTAATHRHLSKLQAGDAILQDILPGQVVGQLLENGHVEPEHLGEVSILFADIVGFTDMSSRLKTTAMIKVLNKLFSAFDKLSTRLGVFKVETIGDCYMCVAGHDLATKEDQGRIMVQMGLSMIDEAREVFLPDGKESVKIRVGINTGPVYAGVVGLSKPRYCLFGDTVNVASRMETTSKPGKVHISEATYLSCFPTRSTGSVNEAGESNVCRAAGRIADAAAANKSKGDVFESTTWFSAAEYCEIKGKGPMLTRFCERQSCWGVVNVCPLV